MTNITGNWSRCRNRHGIKSSCRTRRSCWNIVAFSKPSVQILLVLLHRVTLSDRSFFGLVTAFWLKKRGGGVKALACVGFRRSRGTAGKMPAVNSVHRDGNGKQYLNVMKAMWDLVDKHFDPVTVLTPDGHRLVQTYSLKAAHHELPYVMHFLSMLCSLVNGAKIIVRTMGWCDKIHNIEPVRTKIIVRTMDWCDKIQQY